MKLLFSTIIYLVAVVILVLVSRMYERRAYKRGLEEGYKEGREAERRVRQYKDSLLPKHWKRDEDFLKDMKIKP